MGALLCSGATDRYFRHSFFDNSITPDAYFYSAAKAFEPSFLEARSGHLPVETKVFVTPPNALRLHWISRLNGGWVAEVQVYAFRNRNPSFDGNTLEFWCRSEKPIASGALPRLVMQDDAYGFSAPLNIGSFVRDLSPGKWARVRVPLRAFQKASVLSFDAQRMAHLRFVQGVTDEHEHTLVIDEIRIADSAHTAEPTPAPPIHISARALERHIDLAWLKANEPSPDRWVVYRSIAGGRFAPIGIERGSVLRYADFVGGTGLAAIYKITAQSADGRESAFSTSVSATTHSMTDDELLTMVQEAGFRYYWEGAHPVSGMIRENLPGNDDITAVGATGFGVMALVVGAERRFITRTQAIHRLLTLTDFLESADRFHGAWPHFLNGTTGKRMPVFDSFDNGADLVETSFLMEGLLSARQYFQGQSLAEKQLYDRITRLWRGVEWSWFRRTADGKALYWHWSPEYNWYINHPLYGWNEVMITYLLAIASPTHPVPASLYYTGWAGDSAQFLNRGTYFGIQLPLGIGTGGPLFFTHYSYMGFDPHGLQDRFANYFGQNRNMANINYAYCVANPGRFSSYGARAAWGITAVDGPHGYVPYEPTVGSDDGTIAPTGAISSMPYTPKESLDALRYFYREQGDKLWDIYGFRDAFNAQQNWYSGISMGLNQAPMIVMIENYRTGLIWRSFGANPEIQKMTQAISLQ